MNTVGRCILGLTMMGATFAAFAANELGSLSEARKHYPAVFVSGNVLPYTVAGVEGYTYVGEAEQYFTGNQAESDAELYQEACLDAKGNLLAYLKKSHPSCEITLSGATVMYQYAEGKMRYVVCFVPKDAVLIRKVKRGIQSAAPLKALSTRTNITPVSQDSSREAGPLPRRSLNYC